MRELGKLMRLPFFAGSQQKGSHACRQPHANGANLGSNVVHGVKNAQPCRNRTTRGINVEINILLRIFRF